MPTLVKTLPQDDAVNSPRHYLCPNALSVIYFDQKSGEYYIDALAVIKAWGFQANAYIFNLLKYTLRGGKKENESVLKDRRKAAFYLNEDITELQEQENSSSQQ